MDNIFSINLPLSKKDNNDKIFNDLVTELNNSTQILKSEIGKLLINYEQNNKRIVLKYKDMYNKNKKNEEFFF